MGFHGRNCATCAFPDETVCECRAVNAPHLCRLAATDPRYAALVRERTLHPPERPVDPPDPLAVPPWRPGDGYQPLATRPPRPRHGVGAVSVVIPTAFRPGVVGEAIESALGQTRPPERVIVALNGIEAAESYGPALRPYPPPRVLVAFEADLGIPQALNAALRHPKCDTEYIAVLDDDDLWEPEFLATMVAALDADPCAGLAFCDWRETRDGQEIRQTLPPPVCDLRAMWARNWFGFNAAVFRAAYLGREGLDPRAGGCCDWDTWLRCWIPSGRAVHVPRPLAIHRWNHDNTSGVNPMQGRWHRYFMGKRDAGAYGPEPRADGKPRVPLGTLPKR
jgi:hypothetical protein